MATSGKIIVSGEISCELRPYIDSEVKKALQLCGYSPDDFLIFVNCHRQSRNIANGVSSSLEKRNGSEDRYSSLGAGDQGTVYGYATNETEEMLPLPLVLAHNICREIDIQKRKYRLRGVMPDGKAQVTVEYIAKNIVKAGLAERCQVGISYAIGKAEPIAVSVDSFGTSSITDEELAEIVTKVFDLRPAAIIDRLDLSMPIYKKTSAYGHFNSPDFPWEKTDAVPELMKVAI